MNQIDTVEELTQCVKNLRLPGLAVGGTVQTVAICAARLADTLDEQEMSCPKMTNIATVGMVYANTAQLIRTAAVVSFAFSIVFLAPLMRNNHVQVKVSADGSVLISCDKQE
jgi:hypothetical protein